jgi:hypothetical protein
MDSSGFAVILAPARWAMEQVGLHPADMQVWAFMVVLFMLAWASPHAYGDWVLVRRRRATTGTVVELDTSGDSDTAVIAFEDHLGRPHRFESELPVTGRTRTTGSAVAIVYDPLNPGRAREAGRWLAKAVQHLAWFGSATGLAVYAVWPGA